MQTSVCPCVAILLRPAARYKFQVPVFSVCYFAQQRAMVGKATSIVAISMDFDLMSSL